MSRAALSLLASVCGALGCDDVRADARAALALGDISRALAAPSATTATDLLDEVLTHLERDPSEERYLDALCLLDDALAGVAP